MIAMNIVVLKDMTERVFGSTNGQSPHAWERIEEMVADEFRCQPESISLVESEDGEEIIHIEGEPMARIVHRWRL